MKSKTLKLSGNKIVIPIAEEAPDKVVFSCPTCGGSLTTKIGNQTICYRCKHEEKDEMVVLIGFKVNPTDYFGHQKCKTRSDLQTFTLELVADMLTAEADLPNQVTISVVDGQSVMEKEVEL